MNGILGMIELALGTDMNEKQRRYLLSARESADELLAVLDELLDAAQLTAGSSSLKKGPHRKKIEGTGLWLPVSRHLLQSTGKGNGAKADGTEARATAFPVPLMESGDLSDDRKKHPDISGTLPLVRRTLRILLVEDNLMNRRVLREHLRQRGHRVELAENGYRCLQLLQNGSYDLILLDIEMPVMDGLETIRRIRNDSRMEAFADIPVIGITAFAGGDAERQCLEEGMNLCLFKPVSFRELDEAMEAVMADGRGSSGWGFSDDGAAESAAPDARLLEEANEMRERFSLRSDILLEISGIFREEAPAFLVQIEDGIQDEDFFVVRKAVHGLLNDVGVMGKGELVDDLRMVQRAARECNLEQLKDSFEGIPAKVRHLVAVIDTAVRENG